MSLAEVKSEAHIYGLQSAGSANTTAHELKQELVNEQRMSLIEMRSEMKLEEASVTLLAQQRVAGVLRTEAEARDKAIALRVELQAEHTVAQLSTASNAQLNLALNQAQSAAHHESQEYRHEAAAAIQYKQAASNLDMQLQARARSPGVESNPTMPDAANIARDVLAAITPAQQQVILEQQRVEAQLANMMVSQKETFDSQRIVFLLRSEG